MSRLQGALAVGAIVPCPILWHVLWLAAYDKMTPTSLAIQIALLSCQIFCAVVLILLYKDKEATL